MIDMEQIMEEGCPDYTTLQNQPRVQITRDHISGYILMFRSLANAPLIMIDMYHQQPQEILRDKLQVYEPHDAALECGPNEIAPDNYGNDKIWVQSGYESMRCKLIRLERCGILDALQGCQAYLTRRFLFRGTEMSTL